MRRFTALLSLACALAGCVSGPGRSDPTQAGRAAPTTLPAEQAQLVVAIVYDQFPSWAYAEYEPLLSAEGALRRTSTRGAAHVVELAHAGTTTAAGHAAIFTGVPPSQSGVGSNRVWSVERGNRSIVDAGKHAVFGVPDAYASPSVLAVDSIADAVRKTHGDSAKIVSLSYKDRGAVLSAGRHPDLVLWYDKRLGALTSSTYYASALPAWFDAWTAEHPIRSYFEDWQPTNPQQLERLLRPDDTPGEADYAGFGTTFPHNPTTTTDPKRTFRLMPQSTDQLLDLARESVMRLGLGDDAVPDLLVLSVSSLDYAGHVFGPGSWEYVDHLNRIDKAVGHFLAELEERSTVAVMITSDHGGALLPELATHSQPPAGRIYPDKLPSQLNSAVSGVLGVGEWVEAYVQPFVYLTETARTSGRRDEIVHAVVTALADLDEVHAAFDVREAVKWGDTLNPLERAVMHSVPANVIGDIFLVPQRHSVIDEAFEVGKGTSHGSPWAYDRLVPAVFSGPKVSQSTSSQPLPLNRLSATLCQLLGVAPPSQIADVRPLPGL